MLRGVSMNRRMRAPEPVFGYRSFWAHFLVTLFAFAFMNYRAHADSGHTRVSEDLNSGWLFERQVHGSGALGSFDRDNVDGAKIEPRFQGAANSAYDDSSWKTVDLPHTWNAFDVSDEESGYWRGIGWYRKHFRVDSGSAGKRIVIEFEGVNQAAKVWLNGEFLGEHIGGYTGFSFEIHPRLNEDNVLTVEVNNLFDDTVPPTVKTDYSFYGGIYRAVHLLITDRTYISDMYWTTPDVSRTGALVELHSTITNQTDKAVRLSVNQEVLDPENKKAASSSAAISLGPGETKSLTQVCPPIANPKLWSPDAPNLYTIHTALREDSEAVDDIETPLGLRWYKFDPQHGLILNGARIQIRGTNWHQSYPGMGNALPKSRHFKDIAAMHDMGVNFWRTSHYPHDSATIEASDRLGLMVWEELPINKEIGNVSQYTVNVLQMAREMIQRDRNDPSVFVWGIAGEINAPVSVSKQVVASVAAEYRRLDPTRPVGMHAPRGEEIASLVDVVGGGANPETDKDHLEHPNRPYLDTEYSVALIGRGLYGPGPHSEDTALASHEKYLAELNRRPWMAGGCIWNQFDYDGENYDPVIPHIVSFGMEDIWRIPKEVYFFYQSQWTQKPMVHIVGHWTLPGQEGKKRQVEVLSNQENVELFLNGRSLGVQTNHAGMGLEYPPRIWQLPYEPGTLRAVGRTGADYVSDEQKTAGPAFKIVLTSDTLKLASGDPESLAYITAFVTDEAGVVVPGAHPTITFSSYGPGQLLKQKWLGHSVGTTWETVDGTTRIAFRSTQRSGRATISAYSPGLQADQIYIEVTAPGKPDEMNYKELFTTDEIK
jgi:beta-galactosidase